MVCAIDEFTNFPGPRNDLYCPSGALCDSSTWAPSIRDASRRINAWQGTPRSWSLGDERYRGESERHGDNGTNNVNYNVQFEEKEEDDDDDDEVYGLPEPYVEVCILGAGGFGSVMYCHIRVD